MKNKIFAFKILLFCCLFVFSFSLVDAQQQKSMNQINSQERRIEMIENSVNHLLSFVGEDEDEEKEEVRRTLRNISAIVENIRTRLEEKRERTRNFIECLEDEEFVIYGFKGLPDCDKLLSQFGDYNFVDLIYIECSENEEKCINEMKEYYVPEIQIKGDVYQGETDTSSVEIETGCLF
jgi:ElaB/YqjD/DUF883 family membrane-anchored ribosome-binding protein